jgi:hypothetical protein
MTLKPIYSIVCLPFLFGCGQVKPGDKGGSKSEAALADAVAAQSAGNVSEPIDIVEGVEEEEDGGVCVLLALKDDKKVKEEKIKKEKKPHPKKDASDDMEEEEEDEATEDDEDGDDNDGTDRDEGSSDTDSDAPADESGCGDSSTPAPDNGSTDTSGSGGDVPPPADTTPPPQDSPGAISYARDVAPISVASCEGGGCHSGTKPAKGIALDSKTGWMTSFDDSLAAIRDGSMPLARTPLTDAEIATLEAWKAAGFPD